MTQEQKRIKIAEACGWHEEKEPVGSFNASAWWHSKTRYPPNTMPIPDYFNDLNAMHEVEKTLTAEERRQFAMMLNTIHPTANIFYPDATTRSWESDLCAEVFELVSTTAAKRANAFGRVKGLWE